MFSEQSGVDEGLMTDAGRRDIDRAIAGLAGRLPAELEVTARSEDGTVISALVWVPFNLKRDHGAPAVEAATKFSSRIAFGVPSLVRR